MTRTLMRERYGVELAREEAQYLFIGDSPNDAPCSSSSPIRSASPMWPISGRA